VQLPIIDHMGHILPIIAIARPPDREELNYYRFGSRDAIDLALHAMRPNRQQHRRRARAREALAVPLDDWLGSRLVAGIRTQD
jgi:hypothetical protein